MPYKFKSSHWLRANLAKDFFLQMNFPPMRALEFIRDHMTFNSGIIKSSNWKPPLCNKYGNYISQSLNYIDFNLMVWFLIKSIYYIVPSHSTALALKLIWLCLITFMHYVLDDAIHSICHFISPPKISPLSFLRHIAYIKKVYFVIT